ncbi:hypothetical protein [Moorena sp. SIO4G3]|uniref:hypothetical protein n=1 Tax=Moorena sp. SIO4G3 TaxID=2607821 RepID=UPI00142AC4F4|nr:hypothetical protein [Moorena sp. SIO4G3]NEO76885.1 hypothetical protein [Moorena sp. SIO4G3]
MENNATCNFKQFIPFKEEIMLSEKFEQWFKAIPATLVAIALLIGFTVFTQPVHAAPTLSCDVNYKTTLNKGDTWDSLNKVRGPVYGFRASGYGDHCTWTAEVNNYHDKLSFDDLGNSESVVVFETPNTPANVKLDNNCSQPLNLEACSLY